jgi:tRNA A-37 threonylcarbamoyl transferase component Bud32
MAEVYAGQALGSHGFQKPVAVKRLLPELADDDGFVERLIDEAKLLVGMQHGNIVSVLDLVREGDDVFLVMEFVDGPSLRQLQQARTTGKAEPMSLGLATHIVAAAGAGLEFAHRRRGGAVIHADVSPSNLLLTTAGEVKVADFGIARREGIAAAVEGKWAYMAPEQARGEALDARADVFALGVVLYELVTGRHPFGRRRTGEEPEDCASRPVIRPRVVRPEVPVELDAIVMRAMAFERDDRFASVQSLIDALTELRFREGWREGPAELSKQIDWVRQHLRGEAPRSAATVVTGKPLTILTGSLLGAVPSFDSPGADAPGLAQDERAATPAPTVTAAPVRRSRRVWIAAPIAIAVAAAIAIPFLSPPPAISSAEPSAPAPAPAPAPIPVPVPVATPPPPPEIIFVEPESAPPKPSPRKTAARPAATPRKPAGNGTLRVHAEPWAYAEIGDHKVETPARLTLPAGRHKLKLHNPETGARVTRWVTIEAGKVETVKVQMEEGE